MEAKKENRGGARPGAGRKPSPVKRAAVSLYLTPEEKDALRYLRASGIDIGEEILRLAARHKAGE